MILRDVSGHIEGDVRYGHSTEFVVSSREELAALGMRDDFTTCTIIEKRVSVAFALCRSRWEVPESN
jgi:hypothetical protein